VRELEISGRLWHIVELCCPNCLGYAVRPAGKYSQRGKQGQHQISDSELAVVWGSISFLAQFPQIRPPLRNLVSPRDGDLRPILCLPALRPRASSR